MEFGHLFKGILLTLLVQFLCCGIFAQNGGGAVDPATGAIVTEEKIDTSNMPPIGVYERVNIKQKIHPIPYPYIREADMLWSKIIWRMIDLRQKINFPLYYPTVRMRDRKSVTQTLYDAIQQKEIYAYDPDRSLSSPGDEFVTRMTPTEVRERLSGPDIRQEQTSMTTGRDTVWIIPATVNWAEVRQIIVKEEWFFDSKRSVLEVRIIGLCPVREYVELIEGQEEGVAGQLRRQPVFWVYYPEARKALAKEAFYNPKNDAQVSSYDDLFFKRRFGSYIIRETNEYNNRSISDYKFGGIPNLQESDRVYYDIFNKEHDLWEY